MIKKKVILATACLAAVCMLGGCGSSKSAESATELTTEAAAEMTAIDIDASEYFKLGKYKGLTIEGASTKVTDEDVQAELDNLADENVEYEEVTDRDTVKKGDYVNVDYTTLVDGKEQEDYSSTDVDMCIGDGELNIDEDTDVDAKLTGAKAGDTVKIDFTFSDDYDDLSGKKAQLAVTINKIEKEVTPEITDAFIKANTDCSTVEEYKKQVRQELEDSAKSEAESTNQETLWDKILDNAEQIKDFPDDVLKQAEANAKTENEEYASYFGLSVDDFLSQYYEMTLEEYAKYSLKSQCVQDLLSEAISVEVTDEDVDAEIQTYIDEYGYEDKDDVLEAVSEDDLRAEISFTKLMDALMKETTVK